MYVQLYHVVIFAARASFARRALHCTLEGVLRCQFSLNVGLRADTLVVVYINPLGDLGILVHPVDHIIHNFT
jgi:hypothetical protein